MSFSSELKSELCDMNSLTFHQQTIILYGLFYGFKSCDENEIYIKMANSHGINLLNTLVLKRFKKIKTQLTIEEETVSVNYFKIPNKEDRLAILDKLELSNHRLNSNLIDGSDESAAMFIRGLFITCGRIVDPEKDYRLEFTFNREEKAKEILEFLSMHGFSMKLSFRRGLPVVYVKKSGIIEDLLTFMGAYRHSMELMNVKIYKDFRNKVNRRVNCESANLDKTVTASQRQVADIEYIIDEKGKDFLQPELLELALLRTQHIEMSLRELGEALEPPISRSGVNHRLEKISRIAEELRKGSK